MQQKRRYYQIQFWFIPDIWDNFGDVAHLQLEKYLREIFTSDMEELLYIPQKEVDRFFGKDFYVKRICISKETHEKWKSLSRSIKKRIYYLVNKKLWEVLKDEFQNY
jgi:hypothetical protein